MKKYCFHLVPLFLLLTMVPLLSSQETNSEAQDILQPTDNEVLKHLLGQIPIVRVDFRQFEELGSMGTIPVSLTVDEQGIVTSAKIQGEDEDEQPSTLTKAQLKLLKTLMAEAKRVSSQMRFRPFEQGSRPVLAKFEIEIPVRDSEPTRHVLFPKVHDRSSLRMTLSRSGCFGACPSYRVEVNGDGSVLYEGHRFVAVKGKHRASISSEVVGQLLEAFRAADFYSLKDKYRWAVTDNPTYITSISIDGKTKQVIDYVGERVGMPESVSKLETTIDRLSGVQRWTEGNSETAAALAQENFDFSSEEASTILANVAQLGSVDGVRNLLAAGVTISTKPSPNRDLGSGTALDMAASRGDMEMLHALLTAGVKDPIAKTDALQHAALKGRTEAMRLLIQYGANPTEPEVLVSAAASGHPGAVQLILNYRPDPNSRGREDQTALLSCLETYHYDDKEVNQEEVIRMLLGFGTDPNLADKAGKTPLIVNADDLHIAQLLVSHGANVNARANDGFTPLLNARTVDVTRFLLQHGADPFAKTKSGQTALDWAKQMGRKDQAALLEAAMAGRTQ